MEDSCQSILDQSHVNTLPALTLSHMQSGTRNKSHVDAALLVMD